MPGRILQERAEIRRIAAQAKRVAVLGMKTEKQRNEPAFYVPEYMKLAGVQIFPVPVYYPDVREILGEPVFRRVQDVPGPIDIVDVFRRPSDLGQHLDDLIAARPACVWLQSGIRDDAFAHSLADAGIDVVQSLCLMVEHRLAR